MSNKKTPPKKQPVPKVVPQEVQQRKPAVKKVEFKIGVLCSDKNIQDVLHYIDEYKKIKNKHRGRVRFIFFGYDPAKDTDYAPLSEFEHEFVKPVSINHYFKQLRSLDLDLLFIPLIPNFYNITSENYNKYLEAGILGVPVMTINIFPYNQMIIDKRNGFLLNAKEDFSVVVADISQNVDGVKNVGKNARQNVVNDFGYSKENVEKLSNIFNVE